MKEFFGYGRKRDESGLVVKWFLNTYVNCLHTQIGHARENMEVLIAEFDMSEIKYVGQMSSSQNSRVIDPSGISYAVTNGHKDGEPKIIERDTPMKGNYKEPRICTMVGRDPNNPSSRVRSDHYEQFLEMGDDVSNTLTSVQKDNLVAEPQPYDEDYPHVREFDSKEEADAYIESLRIPQATKQGYIEVPPGSVFDASYPDSKTRRGRVQEGGQVSPTLMAGGEAPCYYEGVEAKVFKEGNYHKSGHNASSIVNPKGLSPTVMENHGTVTATIEPMSYRIRKLTPRECFRLMGVSETDIDKIQASGVSRSQQYKMAGNSIVVDVLEHIFRKMFVNTGQESQQLSLF